MSGENSVFPAVCRFDSAWSFWQIKVVLLKSGLYGHLCLLCRQSVTKYTREKCKNLLETYRENGFASLWDVNFTITFDTDYLPRRGNENDRTSSLHFPDVSRVTNPFSSDLAKSPRGFGKCHSVTPENRPRVRELRSPVQPRVGEETNEFSTSSNNPRNSNRLTQSS